MYKLYLKEHKNTGLKYLGYTKREDCHQYQGSGVYWKKHIKKHGYSVQTKILFETNNKDELKKMGMYYSNLWNVSDNPSFANLKTEEGISGSYSLETRMKMSESAKKRGAPKTAWTSEDVSEMNRITWSNPEIRRKRLEGISKSLTGKKRGPQSEETKRKKSIALKGRAINKGRKYKMKLVKCPHCGKEGKGGNMTRYHFDKCKNKQEN